MRILFTILLIAVTYSWIVGQTVTYNYFYRVYLTDKGTYTTRSFTQQDILSSKAIEKRKKSGINIDMRDIPVYQEYVDQIAQLGFNIHCKSKWMNTVLIKTELSADTSLLTALPFVKKVKTVKITTKGYHVNKENFDNTQTEETVADYPITQINGSQLHEAGFDGKNILIAVLDGGFTYANSVSSLQELRTRNGIKGEYNFIENNDLVYKRDTHGTKVLSVLAGNLEGQIRGTAPGADYLLLITEDTSSEFPCEEDFWAVGAEYADSAGADIISSSLGYFNFDDPSMNYSHDDLDGNSAFITIAADIAASKGILVVSSAGNERNKSWKKIIFPSDGDSVLAVGAIDSNDNIAAFSSAGLSADGRIKPDNVAMGVNVPVQFYSTLVGTANGTSLSCPVLSGMAACLMQAVPEATNMDIIKVFHESADKYNIPDSLYGYGIPDIMGAFNKLQEIHFVIPEKKSSVSPNPNTGEFNIIFNEEPKYFSIEIISMKGNSIYKKYSDNLIGRVFSISGLIDEIPGIYFVIVKSDLGKDIHKVIKYYH